MVLGPRLDLRQGQQLVMTPQLQQAIKLLALTNLELESFIAAEVEKNPLLEASDNDGDGPDGGPDDIPLEADGADGGDSALDGDLLDGGADVPTADALLDGAMANGNDSPLDIDIDSEIYHHDSASDRMSDGAADGGLESSLSLSSQGSMSGGQPDEDLPGIDGLLIDNRSLTDHLHDQARAAFRDPQSLAIATYLIDLVDDAGYLSEPVEEVAARLGASLAQALGVLKVLQTFEPAGVCARSLGECLKIQAREADRLDPAMEALLDNLDVLAKGDLAALRRICGVDQEDLADMIQELRGYNPKPGLAFGSESAQTVVPDIFVRRMSAGGWGVELNTATLPRVLVNRTYYAELSTRASKAERLFLSECLQSANWLVKALDQRARTILKVATELVRQQEEFFEQGVKALKPLNLKHIAEAIGMHESTVSRVTANKFLACQRGVFELKYFFTSAIQSADGGDAHSAEAVKQRIKELIDQEKPDAILSDDKLVEILVAEKFDIARRTVAKYREALKIPSSVQRRRLKMLEAGQRMNGR
ncbi:RNA polymerase factor sigma-54 [Pedomonas mirosovicensis]|uniref:RNA polymerase factor sigma-54 n=1 Tax=Pedomonas mirosovicensis TaxID=2908641 RepID=UPI002169C9EF|nr:RNA polymerase factor sigma-54 [Pedomonas mirosovicensis]MCH8684057.1 RNA polymerase factor sigma-54 [Pedomonas mirosovicensis]